MTSIPEAIDRTLMALASGTDYSPSLRKGVDRTALYVMRAFGVSPPDAGALNKALARVQDCLATAEAHATVSADIAAIPRLRVLLGELQAQLASAQPAVAPAASAGSDVRPPALATAAAEPVPPVLPPASVAAPPAKLARTLPLGSRFTDDPSPSPTPPQAPPPSPTPPPSIAPSFRWPEPVAPAPPPPPPPAPRVPAPASKAAPPPPATPPPVTRGSDRVPPAIVSHLAGLYSRRRGLLDDPLAEWRDFQTVGTQIDRAVVAMAWIGGDLRASATGLLAADNEADVFAAILGLLAACGPAATTAALGQIPTRVAATHAGLIAAFRYAGDATLIPDVDQLVDTVAGTTGAAALAALAGHGLVTADRLLNLLEGADDPVATQAALLLAWLGRPASDIAAIHLRLRAEVSSALRCASLFAGVALGSLDALRALRDLFDKNRPLTDAAIDALAIAGGPDDGARLLHLAARQPELACRAVLAAGHLGGPTTIDALKNVDAARDESVLDRARQTILGSAGPTPRAAARQLYGEPWTAAASLQRLTAPDELLLARPWYALEAVVRAGGRPPGLLDVTSSAAAQARMLERLRASLPTLRRAAPGNGWGYFGRSAA